MKNCITIYTDASLCPKTKVSAWGCWIKYDDGKTLKTGNIFKEGSVNSTHAELKAIANALTIVKLKLKPKNCFIVVVTDSQEAIERIKGVGYKKIKGKHRARRIESRKIIIATTELINSLVPETCQLRVKKVKAHSTGDGKRSYVNKVVDKIAKKHLKQKRREIGYGKDWINKKL